MKININNSKGPCQSTQVFVLSTLMVLIFYLTCNFLILIFDILIFPYYFIYIFKLHIKARYEQIHKILTAFVSAHLIHLDGNTLE